MQLASKFRSFTSTRSNHPLSDEEIVRVAPSIFAQGKHQSRSERYAYIPTSDVLKGLRSEGFQPFMVCQTRVRDESRHELHQAYDPVAPCNADLKKLGQRDHSLEQS